jgi:hypothetical protein
MNEAKGWLVAELAMPQRAATGAFSWTTGGVTLDLVVYRSHFRCLRERFMPRFAILCAAALACFGWISRAPAQEEKQAGQQVTLADGKISLAAPADWKKQQPSVRIIEAEFAIPAVDGDKNDGRLTIMAAGGSVEANIDRWVGQFSQPDGKSTKDQTKTEKITVDGQEVHLVDISGTYKDQRGPFAPAQTYENYRMVAAIVSTKDAGRYFLKLYGPQKTIAANEEAFRKMVESLDVK